jgi:hypothetical protein
LWLLLYFLAHKKCGKNHGECESQSGIEPFAYLVILVSVFIITVCCCRCVLLCLSCRNTHNENDSNNNDQPMVTNVFMNPIYEESPPSYEQVMNDHNSYRLEHSR